MSKIQRAARSPLTIIMVLLVLALISSVSRAETVFLDAEPAAKISTADATKRLIKGEETFKCERVKQGPGINPVKIPGSNATWHSAVGEGLEDAATRLADKQPTWRCSGMMIDPKTARVRKGL